jgi:osmoprotectant transport system ATP-binding protein
LPHLRVIDNIATVPVLDGVPRRESRERARELMQTVGLDPSLARRYPAQLSGGQQQRVGVARALASDPNILLMDEPFGAVDPVVRAELQRELLRLQTEIGKTILFVTHDIDEAVLLGDQIVILAPEGRVVQQGTREEILENPADDFVREFVGINGGRRELTLRTTAEGSMVFDGSGRPLGILRGNT